MSEELSDDEKAARDCCEDCYKAYDACYAAAGSDAEKAACRVKLQKCTEGCPSGC